MSDATQRYMLQESGSNDPLRDLLREGAHDLIYQAVENELKTFLNRYQDPETTERRTTNIRPTSAQERTIQMATAEGLTKIQRAREASIDKSTN